jgi:hypothetical protein
VPPSTRLVAYGSAAAFVIAGALCAALTTGDPGQLVGLALIGTGAVLATGLVFLEVGLSEDRERAREAAFPDRERTREATLANRPGRQSRPRARLGQSRGHRRGLR